MDERSIFMQALDWDDPREQQAYLRRACGGDDRLRQRVEALIRSHRAADRFVLDRGLAADLAITADMPPPVERPGSLIGPYKLLEVIGEGGMGVVYMAEQAQPVRRKVALKVIKPGMDTRQVIARFEAERQALALMDHPHIASVFDGGETPGGRPYFVMELVRGIPITEFCDQGHLPIRERLGLFVELCRAIQHAHQKGVIHRDIKPSNVLVTLHDGTPVVKVIDFGIAKATGQQLTDKTLFTNFAQLIGTPLYMSPEQAQLSGLDMDTRSDVYSLGVLLYELLTGLTPFDQERLRTANYDEIRRIILDEEPAKPSTRMSTVGQAATTASANRRSDPGQLGRLFRGELDWIVMKALEKDRRRRYESAGAFADDVQRYLDDEQVLAHPPSTWYRARKFARRHRASVLVAASLALGLLLALGGLISAVAVQSSGNARIRLEQERTDEALAREKDANIELKRVMEAKQQDLYFQGIALAERELGASNVSRAEQLLDGCEPGRRAWEWHYLKRSSRSPLAPLQHIAAVCAVAVSRSGAFLASADIEGRITLWDGRTLRPLRHMPAHKKNVWSLAFSHDGGRLASASADGTVKIWSVPAGEPLQELTGDGQAVFSVSFSPDGRLASLGEKGLTLWDPATPRRVYSIPETTGMQLALGADGRRLASVNWDPDVKLRDAATGELLGRLPGPGRALLSVAFSPDSRLIAAGSGDHGFRRNGDIRIWEAETGRERQTLRGHLDLVASVAFSPDGRRLASAGYDQTIKVWDVETGREALNLRGHRNAISTVVFDADGRLFSASDDRTVRVWDGRDWHEGEGGQELLDLRGHDESVIGVAFSPRGNRFASADSLGIVLLGKDPVTEPDRRSGVKTLRAHGPAAYAIAFSPDGELLAAAGDNSVDVWRTPKGHQTLHLRTDQEGNFLCVAFSLDGRYLAAGGWRGDSGVSIWDVETGRAVHRLAGLNLAVNAMAFTPSHGKYLVTAGEDGAVRVWDWAAEKETCELPPRQAGRITGLAFSPDGRRLACCGWDRIIRTWDVSAPHPRGWKPGRPLLDPTGSVECVAFSPDGRHLAWGGTDSAVKVCDIESRQAEGDGPLIHTLYGHTNWVRSIAFSGDGRHIATGSQDGTVKLWAVPAD